jgi:tetratricopeptide (TPR) repeat protein
VEALFEIDQEGARAETISVHNSILQNALELDIKAFCLARLWATISKIFPDDSVWISEVEAQFDEAFRLLLDDSAEQLEPVIETIQALVGVDPICALTAASELNVHFRRTEATRVVLETTLRKQGEQNVADFIENALGQLNKAERDSALGELTSKLNAREVALTSPNLDVLLKYSGEIADPTLKAQALSNLAGLFRSISLDDALVILEQAVEAWRKEDDLKISLLLGFDLVESMAELDLDRAKQLYAEVQELKFQPGSPLAVGRLGATFRESLDLAIRAITITDLSESDQAIRSLESLILRIPSQVVRVQLFARLAASAYRVGYSRYADDLVRTRVIYTIDLMQSDPEQMESDLDRNIALEFSLPVIFEYDFSVAKSLSDKLPYPTRDEAWYSVVFWALCRSFLGDHQFRPEDLRVRSDYPRLQKAIGAVGEIDYDRLLCGAIAVIANSVQVSFSSMLDLTQALDILQRLDDLASSKLPERSGKNIKHEGYRVLAEAHIHGARSSVYYKTTRRRGLSGKYMRERWQEILTKAKSIPNIADRVFVMALVAPELAQYYRQDRSLAQALLQEAESQVMDIPTLIDRANRLETIAESWDSLGDKTQAQVALEHAFKLISQLEDASADDRLRELVQAAYAMDPNFADDLVSRLDTRLPGQVIHPTDVALEIEKLRSNPSRIDELQSLRHARGTILSRTARKLLRDFACGRGVVVHSSVLENWLIDAGLYHPRASIDTTHWVIENLYRKSVGTSQQSRLDVFLSVAQLTHELAKWISTARGEGIPEVIHDSFPGLSARVEFFRAGEVERAKGWLQNWLSENVEDYLKICDPYFGPGELEYLMYVPLDCRILVVTTDHYLAVGDSPDRVKRDLELYWRGLTSRAYPSVQFLIVPRKLEDRFHDRAVITLYTGLDIGQSLNGLGKSHGKITVLSEEDAKELEKTYVDEMLNNATWFLEGVHPTVLFLGA